VASNPTPSAQPQDGEMSFEQIAQALGISKARVWQLYCSAMGKLRRGDRAETLRSFIGDGRRRGAA
jgi:DNA-directed RNA polymerase sigma subunit (sigma70/sigma32)